VNSGKGGKAIRQTVDFLAGACSGQHILDRHWKQCADWFLKSMGDGAGNPFWAEQGKNYFGDLDDGDNDEEDYVQSSSGRDEFDSDFDQT
jgi:hypothetical protein